MRPGLGKWENELCECLCVEHWNDTELGICLSRGVVYSEREGPQQNICASSHRTSGRWDRRQMFSA